MKKFALILFSILLCATIAGCGDNSGGKPKPIYYTVTFDSQSGSEVESQDILEGNTVRRPDMLTREGYFLSGWYTKSTAKTGTEWNFDTDRVTSDITLYAGWSVVNNIATESLVYKREGDAYTVIKMNGEQSVVVIPDEYDSLPVIDEEYAKLEG